MNTREAFSYLNEDMLFMDPPKFDEAIIGYVERAAGQPVICYDKDKVLKILMEDGMDWDEALEYYEYNIVGAYMGENTPVFLETL